MYLEPGGQSQQAWRTEEQLRKPQSRAMGQETRDGPGGCVGHVR
jgi:hypothetical protein